MGAENEMLPRLADDVTGGSTVNMRELHVKLTTDDSLVNMKLVSLSLRHFEPQGLFLQPYQCYPRTTCDLCNSAHVQAP